MRLLTKPIVIITGLIIILLIGLNKIVISIIIEAVGDDQDHGQ